MASKITRWSGVSWVEVANLDKLLLVDGKLNLTGGTMTGPLIINQTAVSAGLTIGKVTTTEGGEISLVNGNDTSFSIDTYGNQLRIHNHAIVGFQMNYACDNITFTGGLNLGTNRYGGGYRGINWDTEYMIMGDGTNTFVSTFATTGTVFIRAGRNGGAQLAINQSNNHSLSGSLTSGADLVAGSWLYAQGGTLVLGSGVWTSMVGWTNNGDNNWVRSLNGKGIYTSGSIMCNGQYMFEKSAGWVFTHASDTDTGFHYDGDGNFRALANGVNVMWFRPSGPGLNWPAEFRLYSPDDTNHKIKYANETPVGSGEASNGPAVVGWSSVWLRADGVGFDAYLASNGYFYLSAGRSVQNFSSREFKENIVSLDPQDCLDQVLRWRPVEFDFNIADNKHDKGFIAEEMLEVTPRVVTVCGPETQRPGWANAMSYGSLTTELAGAVQALWSEVQQLKEAVA